MGKIILICGKIGAGKTAYAHKLAKTLPAIEFNYEELQKQLSTNDIGDHEKVIQALKFFLLGMAIQASKRVNVILDWGFWSADERRKTTALLKKNHCEYEWHYLYAPDAFCAENVRRHSNAEGTESDKALLEDELVMKLNGIFEEPKPEEMDIWTSCL